MRREKHRLQLEALESRVMLSGVDLPVEQSSIALTQAAIAGSGAPINVELLPYDQVLIVTGSGSGNISIDLSLLPESIVNLQISSFKSVTLLGDHSVNSLTISNIAYVDAGRLSIGQTLSAFNVEHIKIDAAPDYVLLQGANGFGSVGAKTLLEVGRFSSSPNAFIFAWVESLGLATSSHVENVPQIASFPTQSILLNFEPDNPLRVSTEGSVNVIKGGDFTRYFLATAAERAALEQSHLIARQVAVTHFVPLDSVLSNTSVRAALMDLTESSNGAAAARTSGDSEGLLERSAIAINPVEDGKFVTAEPESAGTTVDDNPLDPFYALVASVETAPTPGLSDSAVGTNAMGPELAILGLPGVRAFVSETSGAQPTTSLVGESFDRVITDLRERFATFGDLVTAQVADRLRSDRQMPLLVDTSPTRVRESQGLLFVDI